MKKLCLLFAVVLFLASCENDFELTEDWKDITVVYGLLDQSAATQYIRIEKAFLDPKTSAIIMAQEADSLYYDNITVQLRGFRPGGAGGEVYQLQRVNAEDEGFVREAGIFGTSPNYLYKLTEPLNEEFMYLLVITKNGDQNNQITAETAICEDFQLTSPFDSTSALRFRTNNETTFRWTAKPNTKFCNLKLLINYREAPNSNPTQFENKTLVWEITDFVEPNETDLVRVPINGTAFYQHIAKNLSTGYVREFKSIDIKVGSGGVALYNYIQAGRVNSGITSADIVANYTNLSEGFGVFSSRYYKTFTGFDLEGPTADSLESGYLTRNLGFR